ncbi:DUF5777 family beta-barrel protein [Saccharicrinis carchari]|nr:DUF5777 family beta-barrel protein [Saccharicrinis carchari]
MKKYILLLIITSFGFVLYAQDDEKKVDRPVRAPFESGYLIDNQTTLIPIEGTVEFVIQHKFGTMDNGRSDLFGIYSPGANIRLALNYVPFNNFQIGLGTTKKNMYTDLSAKWTIFEQTRENTIPVAVALYGSLAIDGRNKTAFGSGKVVDTKGPTREEAVAFNDRIAYFSQLIVGRKFTHWLSLQAAASFTHYNMVGWDYNHDMIGLHLNGRIKFSPQGSFLFNYDQPLKIESISEQSNWGTHPQPNVSFGIEFSTSTHAFQIYVGSADGIIPQDIMMFNRNDWLDNGLAIGMTITRLWNF